LSRAQATSGLGHLQQAARASGPGPQLLPGQGGRGWQKPRRGKLPGPSSHTWMADSSLLLSNRSSFTSALTYSPSESSEACRGHKGGAQVATTPAPARVAAGPPGSRAAGAPPPAHLHSAALKLLDDGSMLPRAVELPQVVGL
jgi:hypothetical protein